MLLIDKFYIYIKKINRYIKPAKGFTVIATANTKGRGSDDGKFIGTNILNEAFLERFPITMEQPYPALSVEKKIVLKHFEKFGMDINSDVSEFTDKLIDWADIIRKTFYDDGVDEDGQGLHDALADRMAHVGHGRYI